MNHQEFDIDSTNLEGLRDAINESIPDRMDIFEWRHHARMANSPFHEQALQVVREYEASDEFKQEESLYAMPVEDLEKTIRERHQQEVSAELNRRQVRNAQAWMAARPEYVASQQNSDNLTAYLKEHDLDASPENLDVAFQAIKSILQLKELPPPPAKLYTEEELYTMPLAQLEAIGGNGDNW